MEIQPAHIEEKRLNRDKPTNNGILPIATL